MLLAKLRKTMSAVATEYAAAPSAPRPFWRHLYFWVLVGIALGVLLGWLRPAAGQAM